MMMLAVRAACKWCDVFVCNISEVEQFGKKKKKNFCKGYKWLSFDYELIMIFFLIRFSFRFLAKQIALLPNRLKTTVACVILCFC